MILYLVAVCVWEYRGFCKRAREYRQLAQFAEFLSDLTHEFFLCKCVTESVFRAVEKVQGEVKHYLEELCFLLEEGEAEEDPDLYLYPKHLKHIKLFFLQCRNATCYGSGMPGAESGFARNMTELRRDVQNECYKRSQANFLFGGLGLVAIVPVAFVPLVKQWGMSNLPELGRFYESAAGRTMVVMLWLLTVSCYGLLSVLKRTEGASYRRPGWLNRLLELPVFEGMEKRFAESAAERIGKKRLNAIGLFGNGMEYWFVCGMTAIAFGTMAVGLFRHTGFWGSVLAAGFGMVFGIAFSVGIYRYLAYVRGLGKNGEILGLQSVVLLLFQVPNMTIMKVLETMEEYAELFRHPLAECTDRYASEEEAALERLYRTEEDGAFRQLAGRLMVSERIGLVKAFSELAEDRHFFREQQRLDTEQELKKRAANGQVLAFTPLMFLLFAYLIIPFLIISLGQMTDVFREMTELRMF